LNTIQAREQKVVCTFDWLVLWRNAIGAQTQQIQSNL
jgi:hypothetical protein